MEKVFRLIYNLIRIALIKIRFGKKVNISIVQPMRMSSSLLIQNKIKKIQIGNSFKLEENAKVRVINGGTLIVGDNCFFNCNSYMTVMGETVIGDNCSFGPNVLIFDHDHDFKVFNGLKANKMIIGKIKIGNNVWIGGGSIILRDSEIGDNSVIAAGSIVKGKIPSNTIFIQKRNNELIPYIQDKEL